MVTSLLEHGRIRTTAAKAKELRRVAERTISRTLRLSEILGKPADARSPAEQAKVVAAMRLAGRTVRTPRGLERLFSEVAEQMKGRPGGYTRIVRLGTRVGDGAPMAIIELVGRD
jgi:large subunit ribosomal protein L17